MSLSSRITPFTLGEKMMSATTGLQKITRSIASIPQRVGRYISGAVSRIFGPNDDNYPNTGVQPFEGEPSEEKQKQS
jgi:hypothetical protein